MLLVLCNCGFCFGFVICFLLISGAWWMVVFGGLFVVFWFLYLRVYSVGWFDWWVCCGLLFVLMVVLCCGVGFLVWVCGLWALIGV